MTRLPPDAPTWTDVVLFAMGLFLCGGILVGIGSAVPLRVAGSLGSVGAAVTLVGGMLWNPKRRAST